MRKPKPITFTPAEIRALVAKFRERNYKEPPSTESLAAESNPNNLKIATDPGTLDCTPPANLIRGG